MTDAISRSAVLEKIGRLLLDWEYGTAVNDCYKIVEDAPALDVAPVVHARWIVKRMAGNIIALQCSNCENFDNPSKVRGNFCWNCGARMDGEADG